MRLDVTRRLRGLLGRGRRRPAARGDDAPAGWDARLGPDREEEAELEEFLRAEGDGASIDAAFKEALRARLWRLVRGQVESRPASGEPGVSAPSRRPRARGDVAAHPDDQ